MKSFCNQDSSETEVFTNWVIFGSGAGFYGRFDQSIPRVLKHRVESRKGEIAINMREVRCS